MVTIVVVDDDERFRTSLQSLLATQPSVAVVGEAADGETALELLDALDPDLLVVDLSMPGLNGIETTRRARAVRGRLEILVVSFHRDRQLVEAALEAGASGYVLKDRLSEELPASVATVMAGGIYVSGDLVGAISARARDGS